MLLPVGALANLQSISVACEADAIHEAFAARRLTQDEDKKQFNEIAVANPEAPVAHVVRFTPNVQGIANPPLSGLWELNFEIIPPSDLVSGPAQTPPAAQTSPLAQTPPPAQSPAPAVDTKAPTITGIRTAPDPERAGQKYIVVIGAKDDVKLAARPYSFDGGVTWKSENRKSFPIGTQLEKKTIRVRDAAGNETLHRIVIVVE